MIRFLFLLSVFAASNVFGQEEELRNWKKYFNLHQKEKSSISKSFYAKEDFSMPDTSYVLRDVLFLGRMYIGTYGQNYNRLLTFFQATKKINDSVYSFKAFFKQRTSTTILTGKAELQESYEQASFNTLDTIIDQTQLWKLSIMDNNNDSLFIGWFTCEMELSKSPKGIVLQYMWPAFFNDVSFQNIIVGKFRAKKQQPWQFLQLVPNTYLLYFMPKNNFLELDMEQAGYSDYPICRIKKPYLKKGWNFTKGDWITNRYSIEKVFGYKWIPF